MGGNLEYELQSELKLTSALRTGNLAKRSAAGIKGATGRSAAESPDGVVERIESIQSKLKCSLFAEAEFLLQAGVEDLRPGAANVADGAGAEGTAAGGRRSDHAASDWVSHSARIGIGRQDVCVRHSGNVAGVKPLDVRGNAGTEGYELVLDGDRAVAIWQVRQSVRSDGVGAGVVAVIAPAAEVVQSESVPAVKSENAADLPVADDGVDDVVDIMAELFAAADGKLVGEIAGR